MEFNVKKFDSAKEVTEYSEKYLEKYDYTPEIFEYDNVYEVLEPKEV